MRSSLALAVVAIGLCLGGCRCGGGPVPVLPEKIVGSCVYTNGFSKLQECTDYVGEWAPADAASDCKGRGSTIAATACGIEDRLGYCILGDSGQFRRITFPGTDASACASSKRGCEFFGGGSFDPSPVCGGVVDDSKGTGLPTFQQPVRVCTDPKPGEPPGLSAGGKVCTWEAISGSTEPGRKFEDYASCDRVRTQRPYYPVGAAEDAAREDPRLTEPVYAAELGWVKSQIQASACVCCHSSRAPEGSSNWFVESPNNFINSFFNRGLAMGAGWIDTVGFGAYPAAQNNGFARPTPADPAHGIFPSTDDARMRKFFEGELAARGVQRSVYPPGTYGAGPLDDQRFFVPKACENGEGVASDGTMSWLNGRARYVHVLEDTATSPTVPPNLDLPQGTIWRLDVPADGAPVTSQQVSYGVVPPGAVQRHPQGAAPPALVPGTTYYLYVLADVGIPNTRCLFVAP